MPTLTFESDGKRRGGIVDGRILIGRKVVDGVVIADPAVSRLHAWIENQAGEFVIRDAGSRTGTFVNGEAVVRSELQPGDVITVGPTTLEFRAGGDLPAGVTLVPLSGSITAVHASSTDILFSCTCGAPIYVGAKLAGRRGLCQYCGESLRVPRIKILKAAQVAPPPGGAPPAVAGKKVVCGACHTRVTSAEPGTTCPDCGTAFHTDCWMENLGCSTYGCPQVNVLAPTKTADETASELEPAATVTAELPPPAEVDSRPLLLLGGAVVASIFGSLFYGVPALLVAGLCVRVLLQKSTPKKGLLLLALLLALLGVVGGVMLTRFWRLHR